jgi:sugar/nucleoside kinase (ribokinase family)
LNVFADFQPKLPDSYRSQPYLFLGNIQPALQGGVKKQMAGPRLTGGDTMNYWIQGFRDELLQTIREWDFLLINDTEARLLSGEPVLRRAAEVIMGMGPPILVVKRGEFGAVLFTRSGHFSMPGYLLDCVLDPTGAGDCFAGGFAGYLAQEGADPASGELDPKLLRRAVVYGSVMGSFCCEKFGVGRFRTLDKAQIDARFREFQAVTAF